MNKITPKFIAGELNGLEYKHFYSNHNQKTYDLASAAGIVIVHGMSDDLMEFEGAIQDELGAPGKAYLTNEGLLYNQCDNDGCPHYATEKECATTIEAVWCEDPDIAWTFKTSIPHETFLIKEDGEKFCRGIVFNLADVEARQANPESRLIELEKQRDNLLAALERLSFAALCRDSTMGDQCRLIEVRAELAAANKQAMEAIAIAKGGE